MRRLLLTSALAILPVAALAEQPNRPFGSLGKNPTFDWGGFYAGALVGVGASRSQSRFTYGGVNEGVGFNNGTVQSTWFNGYASGTLPAATNPGLTASASCVYDNGKGCSNGYGSNVPLPSYTSTSQRTDAAVPLNIDSRKLVGALGAEIGYNLQAGALVFGMALDSVFFSKRDADRWSSSGDYSFNESTAGSASYNIPNNDITVNGSVTRTNNGSSQYSSSVNIAPKWLTTVRLSAGVAHDRFLAYASGGLAAGRVMSAISSSYSDSNSSICFGTSGGPSNQTSGLYQGSASVSFDCGGGASNTPASTSTNSSANWRHSRNDMQYGYVLGGGLAFAVSHNVIAKLEAYYYDLGTVSAVVTGTAQQTTAGSSSASTNAASYTVRTKVDGMIGRVGIAYKF